MDLFRRRSTKAPAPELAAKGQFRAKATENLDTVRSKLSAVEQEIQAAEAELSKVSLAAVLADDQTTGFEAVTRLNELRTRREILRHALSAAQQVEQERLAGLKSKADKARDRARAQHIGELERATATVASDLVSLRNSFRKMVAAAEGVSKTLPKYLDGRMQEDIAIQLSPDSLRSLAEVAAYGLSQGGIAAPGCTRAPPNAHTIDGWSGHYPGLVELVGDLVLASLKPKPIAEQVSAPAFAGAPAVVSVPPEPTGVAAPDVHFGVHPAPITGVSINSRGNTDLTERMPAPEPYQETPQEPVEAIEEEEAIAADAPEEIVSQAPPHAEEAY